MGLRAGRTYLGEEMGRCSVATLRQPEQLAGRERVVSNQLNLLC